MPLNVDAPLKGIIILKLYLQEGEGMKCIHQVDFQLRTAYSYMPVPDQDILFIINEHITKADITYIQSFCKDLKLVPNFYDV